MTGKEKQSFEEAREGDVEAGDAAFVEESAEKPASGEDKPGAHGSDEQAGTDPESRLAAAEEEVARHKEAMLRMQAEMENLRKRLNRDLERSRKFALERIMKELLQVRDSLERGQEVSGEAATVEAMKQGQDLTLRMLDKVLENHDLEIIDPEGEAFNPELHEAMTVQPAEDREEGEVMQVLQKGFKLHDRLIRPARVIVSRKP